MPFDPVKAAKAKMNKPMPAEMLLLRLAPFEITERELGWSAGIIDGEACISVTRRKRRCEGPDDWYLTLSVANVDPRMLLELQRLFGGSLSYGKRVRPKHQRAIAYWISTGVTAAKILNTVLPALIIKAEEAEVALAWAATVTFHGGRLPADLIERRRSLAAELRRLHAVEHIALAAGRS